MKIASLWYCFETIVVLRWKHMLHTENNALWHYMLKILHYNTLWELTELCYYMEKMLYTVMYGENDALRKYMYMRKMLCTIVLHGENVPIWNYICI